MGVSARVRQRLVESPDSLGGRARARRWALVETLFPDFADLRVVDLGGTVAAWAAAPIRPRHLTVLNLFEPGISTTEDTVAVTGDACDAAAVLKREIGHATFDVVFSNAVLEHVGGHASRARFADSVRQLAPRHWIQTPYRYFPLEPHWLFPGMQFLPIAARSRIAATWPLSHSGAATTRGEALSAVQWTELIGLTELRGYFPDSQILHEKVGGLTKSLIAVKS